MTRARCVLITALLAGCPGPGPDMRGLADSGSDEGSPSPDAGNTLPVAVRAGEKYREP